MLRNLYRGLLFAGRLFVGRLFVASDTPTPAVTPTHRGTWVNVTRSSEWTPTVRHGTWDTPDAP